MGVWIETSVRLPACECLPVTPCMGVWIETWKPVPLHLGSGVTPCMGVWIETVISKWRVYYTKSHPVWVCGLKQQNINTITQTVGHTLYGCVD